MNLVSLLHDHDQVMSVAANPALTLLCLPVAMWDPCKGHNNADVDDDDDCGFPEDYPFDLFKVGLEAVWGESQDPVVDKCLHHECHVKQGAHKCVRAFVSRSFVPNLSLFSVSYVRTFCLCLSV